MEKTSGVEVIKRLVGQGLIHEFSDLTDKRSVRVSITDKGKME
jgi:DNA-binding MarR family transcriptional regulator